MQGMPILRRKKWIINLPSDLVPLKNSKPSLKNGES